MGIALQILHLRRNPFSSVETLLAALERLHDAPRDKIASRLFQVDEAADLVLTNVAAHAADALILQQPIAGRAHSITSPRRKRVRFHSGASTLQRPLFAASGRSLF